MWGPAQSAGENIQQPQQKHKESAARFCKALLFDWPASLSYLRADVPESKGSVVLVQYVGRYLLGDDLIKDGWLSGVSLLGGTARSISGSPDAVNACEGTHHSLKVSLNIRRPFLLSLIGTLWLRAHPSLTAALAASASLLMATILPGCFRIALRELLCTEQGWIGYQD